MTELWSVMPTTHTQIELEQDRGRATGVERTVPGGRAERVAGGGAAAAVGGFPRTSRAWGPGGPFKAPPGRG